MGSTVAVFMDDKNIENLKIAMDIFSNKVEAKIIQKDFLQLVLKSDAKELAEMALRNMRKNIDKIQYVKT